MVEKIIVQPEKVRGGGNIVSPPKTVTDFSLYNSSLSLTDNVYTLVYEIQGIVITLSASPVSVTVGESVTFTATVTEDGDPLEGVTVSFKEGSTVIGTGETNSSGVATLVKSDLSVGSHSVVAGYSTGVSSAVSVTVSDVPTPTPSSISLTGTKSILSYADSESSVLTATVLDSNDDPMEGVTVTFYNGSTSMGTADTNSSGIASKTYSSAGAGDVSFTAEVGSLVSETYVIEDCTYYSTTEYSSTSSLDISLPSTFKLSFAFKPTDRTTSSAGNSAYVRMGTSSTSGIWVGQGTSSGNHGIMVRPSTNTWCSSVSETGTWNEVECTFDGSTLTYTCNSESVSTSTSISTLSKINGAVPTSKCHLKEIKVKPL